MLRSSHNSIYLLTFCRLEGLSSLIRHSRCRSPPWCCCNGEHPGSPQTAWPGSCSHWSTCPTKLNTRSGESPRRAPNWTQHLSYPEHENICFRRLLDLFQKSCLPLHVYNAWRGANQCLGMAWNDKQYLYLIFSWI